MPKQGIVFSGSQWHRLGELILACLKLLLPQSAIAYLSTTMTIARGKPYNSVARISFNSSIASAIMERGIAYTWGSTLEERQMPFPCDRYMDNSDEAYFRAISVEAPVEILFRWLCQLKAGSYSYDWIDRLEGVFFQVDESISQHPSPKQLLPGLENLAPNQRVMGIFKLVEFEPNRHLTIVLDDEQAISIFGEIAASYVVLPKAQNTCRLILKGLIRYPRNSLWSWMRYFLPWGDLFMMRQQFLRLKSLAESQTVSSSDATVLRN